VASLTTLRLRHNGVGDAGCAALAAALRLSPPLLELDLRLNAARGAGAEAMAAALSLNSVCQRILLSGNALDADVALKIHASGDARLQLWDAWAPPPAAALLPPPEGDTADGATAAAALALARASAHAGDAGWDSGWWDGGIAAGAIPTVAPETGPALARWRASALATIAARSRAQLARGELLVRLLMAAITLTVAALFAFVYRKWLH
jgi:hypothetical protein